MWAIGPAKPWKRRKAGRQLTVEIMIVDLPGTYSLAAYSVEEIIAHDYLLSDRPGTVIAVVDAANLRSATSILSAN